MSIDQLRQQHHLNENENVNFYKCYSNYFIKIIKVIYFMMCTLLGMIFIIIASDILKNVFDTTYGVLWEYEMELFRRTQMLNVFDCKAIAPNSSNNTNIFAENFSLEQFHRFQ